jgi:hypothetical protein
MKLIGATKQGFRRRKFFGGCVGREFDVHGHSLLKLMPGRFSRWRPRALG